jgi:hypothetical protein
LTGNPATPAGPERRPPMERYDVRRLLFLCDRHDVDLVRFGEYHERAAVWYRRVGRVRDPSPEV